MFFTSLRILNNQIRTELTLMQRPSNELFLLNVIILPEQESFGFALQRKTKRNFQSIPLRLDNDTETAYKLGLTRNNNLKNYCLYRSKKYTEMARHPVRQYSSWWVCDWFSLAIMIGRLCGVVEMTVVLALGFMSMETSLDGKF